VIVAFKSQLKESKVSSRRGSSALVVVSQSYKPSTKSEELSFRLPSSVLSKIDLNIGDRADVLFDEETKVWMIIKEKNGFSISGKKGGPTGLIRYTLKEGHARLTNERSDLPVKKESDDSTVTYNKDSIVFRLEN
jgi:hypothetical protein